LSTIIDGGFGQDMGEIHHRLNIHPLFFAGQTLAAGSDQGYLHPRRGQDGCLRPEGLPAMAGLGPHLACYCLLQYLYDLGIGLDFKGWPY
jgi:hypothetical protein